MQHVLRPETIRIRSQVELYAIGRRIVARFPEYSDHFRRLMYENGFRWTGVKWSRDICDAGLSVADVLAEVAHIVLAAGYMVVLEDDAAYQKSVSGDYTADHRLWIKRVISGPWVNWFALHFPRDDVVYGAFRSLPGSRYRSRHYYVPASAIEALVDFAAKYEFRWAAQAAVLRDECLQRINDAVLVVPRPASGPRKPVQREALTAEDAESEIADEFRDDDPADEPSV